MTVSFKTFGCRLNKAETTAFEVAFAAAGVACVAFGKPADIVVIHSCAVTQTAEDECLKLLRTLRRKMPSVFLVMAGCAAEAVAMNALKAAGADLVVTREQKANLPELVLDAIGWTCQSEASAPVPTQPATRHRALLKVQDGCDFFCAYCIVPHTRGAPRSIPLETCLREAERFIAEGYQEIVVTGCNIACYADEGRKLVDLLAALAALPGLGRLRLGSIEPGTVEGEVAAFMASSDKVCKFLHIPIQSGSDAVLARMGRRYNVAQLEAALRHAQALMPDAAFGADFICGFPGESEAAFAQTVRLIESFPFSNLHIFPYSERPGTPACEFAGSVPLPERRVRAKQLITLGQSKRETFAQRFVGKETVCLVERFDSEGRARGWSGEYLPCVVAGVPHTQCGALCAFIPDYVQGDTLYGSYP